MTTTPLTPKGLNSWKTTSTIVACARFAASISAPLTVSRLLMASRSQSNNSRSRCRPKAFNRAGLLSSPFIYRTSPATLSRRRCFSGKFFAAVENWIHCRVANLRLQEKNAVRAALARRRADSARAGIAAERRARRADGSTRRSIGAARHTPRGGHVERSGIGLRRHVFLLHWRDASVE